MTSLGRARAPGEPPRALAGRALPIMMRVERNSPGKLLKGPLALAERSLPSPSRRLWQLAEAGTLPV